VTPRSRCPSCARPIPWHENIPLLSFLFLRGRCRGCGAPISWRYPIVEALTGALFLAAAWLLVVRFPGGWREPGRWVHLAAGWVLLGDFVALTFIDLDHRLLPDRLTKPGMAAGAIFSVLHPSLQRTEWLPSVPEGGAALLLSVAGMVLGYGSLWLVGWAGEKALRKEAMGLGDAKLLAMVGAFCGPLGVLLAAFAGFVLGILLGLAQLARTGDNAFPFGPALAAGGAAAFLAPRPLAEGILALVDLLHGRWGPAAMTLVLGFLLLLIRRKVPRGLFLALAAAMIPIAALAVAQLLR